jgi:hypothetical protein
MGYSGAGGKLIHEKNQKQKISRHCPFKGPPYELDRNEKVIRLFIIALVLPVMISFLLLTFVTFQCQKSPKSGFLNWHSVISRDFIDPFHCSLSKKNVSLESTQKSVTVYVYTVYLFTQRGGEANQREGQRALVHKAG